MKPERFKQLRKESGLTQEEFGKRIGLSARTVRRFENSDVELDLKTSVRNRVLGLPINLGD